MAPAKSRYRAYYHRGNGKQSGRGFRAVPSPSESRAHSSNVACRRAAARRRCGRCGDAVPRGAARWQPPHSRALMSASRRYIYTCSSGQCVPSLAVVEKLIEGV